MAIVSSTFDGSENPLSESGAWSQPTNWGALEKASGYAQVLTKNVDAAMRRVSSGIGADQYSKIVPDANSSASNLWSGVCVRMNSDGSCYLFTVSNRSTTFGKWNIDYVDSGFTFNNIATGTYGSYAIGQEIEVQVEGSNPNITITCLIDGVQVTQQTNQTQVDSGDPGIQVYCSSNTLSDVRINSFEAGDLGTGTVYNEDVTVGAGIGVASTDAAVRVEDRTAGLGLGAASSDVAVRSDQAVVGIGMGVVESDAATLTEAPVVGLGIGSSGTDFVQTIFNETVTIGAGMGSAETDVLDASDDRQVGIGLGAVETDAAVYVENVTVGLGIGTAGTDELVMTEDAEVGVGLGISETDVATFGEDLTVGVGMGVIAFDQLGGYASQITRHNITWTFDQPYLVGQYVMGDWWVRENTPGGGVQITAVSPAQVYDGVNYSSLRNGNVLECMPDDGNPYDGRAYILAETEDNDNPIPSFPLTMAAGQSLISSESQSGEGGTDYTGNSYSESVMQSAEILTCVAAAPAANSFRPPYVNGTRTFSGQVTPINKALFAKTTADINWANVPNLTAVGGALVDDDPAAILSDMDWCVRMLERPQLLHNSGFLGRFCHPIDQMRDYHQFLIRNYSDALILACQDTGVSKTNLVHAIVQVGIDVAGLLASVDGHNVDPFDNGESTGDGKLKSFLDSSLPTFYAIFVGHILDDTYIRDLASTYTSARGYENVYHIPTEAQTQYNPGGPIPPTAVWTGHSSDYGYAHDGQAAHEHEHLHPDDWWTTTESDADPNITKTGQFGEGYRRSNTRNWPPFWTVLRYIGHEDKYTPRASQILGYVQRWLDEGTTYDAAVAANASNDDGRDNNSNPITNAGSTYGGAGGSVFGEMLDNFVTAYWDAGGTQYTEDRVSGLGVGSAETDVATFGDDLTVGIGLGVVETDAAVYVENVTVGMGIGTAGTDELQGQASETVTVGAGMGSSGTDVLVAVDSHQVGIGMGTSGTDSAIVTEAPVVGLSIGVGGSDGRVITVNVDVGLGLGSSGADHLAGTENRISGLGMGSSETDQGVFSDDPSIGMGIGVVGSDDFSGVYKVKETIRVRFRRRRTIKVRF